MMEDAILKNELSPAKLRQVHIFNPDRKIDREYWLNRLAAGSSHTEYLEYHLEDGHHLRIWFFETEAPCVTES
jgi:hypothetical protein